MSASTRQALVVFALLLCSYAYFYQAGGWGQNSRFALVRAIIERHTVQIDAYQLHTGDRALFEGHYYSDKAPGASLLALPPVSLAYLVARLAGVDPLGFSGIAWTSYIAAVTTSGLFTALAAWALMWVALRLGASRNAALVGALAYGLATPAWAYGTLFLGHGLAAGCLMLAFAAAVAMDDADATHRHRLAWALGLAGGWAVVTEFPAAIAAIFIGLLALDTVRARDGRDLIPVIARIAAGVVIAAIPMLVYNTLAFHTPFYISYTSEENFQELHQGFFGITAPRLSVIVELLFGRFRGLLPIAPVAALCPLGLALATRYPRASRPALVAAAVSVYYLLLNASYFFWEGGWAFGPRQMMASMPFLCLGIPLLWTRASTVLRAVIVAACVWGTAVTLVAVSTTPQPPADFKAPLTDLLWPAFKDGDLSLNHQTMVHGGASPGELRGRTIPHAAWNLGERAGLRGLPSLLPLLAAWALAGMALVKTRE